MANQVQNEKNAFIVEQFKPGLKIDSGMGRLTVKDTINDKGGQGVVFLVSVEGQNKDYAMKICMPRNLEKYNNLKKQFVKIIEKKPLSLDMFAWPLCLIEVNIGKHSYIGYVMKYVKGYEPVRVVVGNASVDPVTRLKVCINICTAMRQIHEMQLSYKDISDNNVLVNSDTGDIVIIDNDNITENYEKTTMSGTPGYRAPEILDKSSYAVRNSDLHSLAVLLFRIIFSEHPLHSKAFHEVNQNDYNDDKEKYYKIVYSEKACFLFKDLDNLDKYINTDGAENQSVKKSWELYTKELRALFHYAFVDALKDPNKRQSAAEFQQTFVRELSKLYFYNCPNCGILDALFCESKMECESCMREIAPIRFACIRDNKPINIVPLYDGKEIYTCFLDPKNILPDLSKPAFISRIEGGRLTIESLFDNTLFIIHRESVNGNKNEEIKKGRKYTLKADECIGFFKTSNEKFKYYAKVLGGIYD